MGRKRKPTMTYQEEELKKTIDKKCYRVVFDENEGDNGAHRLYCNNKPICSRKTLDDIGANFI